MCKKNFLVLEILLFFLINISFTHADSEIFVNPDTNHSYQVINTEMTWTQAYSFCMNSGGYLATLTSFSENDYVYYNLVKPTKHYCWLGGTDIKTEGDWRWITGETWKYANWGEGEPNNYCANEQYLHTYWHSSNAWNDQLNNGQCASYGLMYPLCEWSTNAEYYSLTVVSVGNGAGSVVSNPVGISCGENCQIKFMKNAEIKLYSNADEGSIFVGWSGYRCLGRSDCIVVLNRDITIEAIFENCECDQKVVNSIYEKGFNDGYSSHVKGDYNSNEKLGLGDCIGILQNLSRSK